MQKLKGQKALVTGSSSGIGRSIAIELGRAGADVIVNYHSHPKEAEEVVSLIQSFGSQAIAIQADVAKENEIKEMFHQMLQQFGTIDILVNNSGVQRDALIDEMTIEQWNEVLQTNLTGTFLCAQQAIHEFKRRGVVEHISKAAGKIIFISSVHEVIPWAGHANYAASKGGMKLLMQTLAQELAIHHIRVNSVAPGAIRTNINKDVWESSEGRQKMLDLIPYKRIGDPEDVAHAVVWLVTDEADYVTGITLFVDGGMCLYPGFEKGG